MNLHLERRLEVLAREIAARKAPKIDHAANELFALAARKHEQKAPSDWVGKNNGAAKASTAAEKVGTTRPSPEAAPPNSKFKVGDRVRPSPLTYSHAEWDESTITKIDIGTMGQLRVWGLFKEKERETWCGEDQLTLIPTPDAEGWIEWNGGECPIPGAKSAGFEIRFRSGSTHLSYSAAEAFSWICFGEGVDIVAYRLVKP